MCYAMSMSVSRSRLAPTAASLLLGCASLNPDYDGGSETGESDAAEIGDADEGTGSTGGSGTAGTTDSTDSTDSTTADTSETDTGGAGICRGSERFCDEVGAYCDEQGDLVRCEFLEVSGCIGHTITDCETQLGPGAICQVEGEGAACAQPGTSFTLTELCASGLELFGDAGCYYAGQDPIGVTVTQPLEDTRGGVFYPAPMPLAKFSTSFSFELRDVGGGTDANGITGADGLSLIIHGDPGYTTGFLGYTMLDSYVAVEFDTWKNNNDDSSNHVGVMLNGSSHGPSQPEVAIPGSFEDGSVWYAWVDYDGAALRVYVSSGPDKPGAPVHSQAVDLSAHLGASSGRFGFGGSTGSGWESSIVRSWTYAGQDAP